MVKTLKRKRPNTPSSAAGPLESASEQSLHDGAVFEVGLLRPTIENADQPEVTTTTWIRANVQAESAICSSAAMDQADLNSAVVTKVKVPVFKDPSFVHSSKTGQASKKSRVWKNLKQIITAEKAQSTGPNDVTYATIDAPPSCLPAKKYSDISGLPAKYTDPQTKLRYASVEEFARIRMLPADVIAAYLAVRKANLPVS